MVKEQTRGIPQNPTYGVAPKFGKQVIAVDAAITLLAGGIVELTKAGALAVTLADPAQDGALLGISSKTAQAHVVTIASGLHGIGAAENVATFGGAIDDCLLLMSVGGYWVQVANVNVTVA